MIGRALPRAFLGGVLDLLFAPICLGCGGAIASGAGTRSICPICSAALRPLPLPRCERCWTPKPLSPPGVATRESCATCDALPPSVRAIRSAFLFAGPARQLVHALKYGGWTVAAPPMAERMAALLLPTELRDEVRLVVPVPISPLRLRERGYNQASLLASELARLRGWQAAPDLLERSGESGTQTTLRPQERRANVAGAFRVPSHRAAVLRREHVLVVDDVWTTGATALACAQALIDSGARAVSVLTFARAHPG